MGERFADLGRFRQKKTPQNKVKEEYLQNKAVSCSELGCRGIFCCCELMEDGHLEKMLAFWVGNKTNGPQGGMLPVMGTQRSTGPVSKGAKGKMCPTPDRG